MESEGWCVISGFILSDFLPSENIQFMNEIISLQQIVRDCMECGANTDLYKQDNTEYPSLLEKKA